MKLGWNSVVVNKWFMLFGFMSVFGHKVALAVIVTDFLLALATSKKIGKSFFTSYLSLLVAIIVHFYLTEDATSHVPGPQRIRGCLQGRPSKPCGSAIAATGGEASLTGSLCATVCGPFWCTSTLSREWREVPHLLRLST